MASPQSPNPHPRPSPKPPETHPKSTSKQPLLEQNHSDPQDLHVLQGDKDLQQAGELLAQVSLYEGEETENRRNKQANNHIIEEQEVDLAMIMQSLQIAIPEEIEVGYQGEEIQKSEESSPFQLLMKVACSSGTPRNIPLQPLNEAMSKAWGNNYWIIDQVEHAVYKAFFRDDDAMDFVLQRQPWSLEGDNFLLEWINPKNADKNPDDYKFNFIYVPIRVYGVPQRFRTPQLMQYVIDNVAQPSDIHPPPDIKMTIKNDYISAYAKMDVTIPVKDKVKYYVSPDEYIMFYLNYDRIKRICTFCGLMFHTVQFCPNRRKLILHLQSIGASTASVPFSYVGIWTSQATKIPQEAFEQAKVVGGLTPQFRQSMKVDKSKETTSMSLSKFTYGLNEQKGAKLLTLKGLTQSQWKQKSLLGPLPQLPPRNDMFIGEAPLQDKGRNWNQHNSTEPHYIQLKDSEQLNLSTQASYKRQQPSESSGSEHRLKRQATADLIREREQEEQNKKDQQNLYRPPQMRDEQTSGRKSLLVGERKLIRPKGRSRWDDIGVEPQPLNKSVPNVSVGVLESHIAEAVQQAQKIASKLSAVNASQGSAGSGDTESIKGQAQLDIGDTASTQALHDDLEGENVDMDFEAAAPAFKAPRAP